METEPLYVGTNGCVAALNPINGEELWRTRLPHGGGSGRIVCLLIKGTILFVGCHGYAYCLNRENGDLLWENDLTGMGYHAVLLAMAGAEAPSVQTAATAEQKRAADAAAQAGSTT